MSLFAHSQGAHQPLLKSAPDSGAVVPSTIAILLTAMLGVALAAPLPVFLPALALVAAALATVAGIAGWISTKRFRSALLTSAGIFAFAAAAAAMLGTPDKVALFLR